MAAATSSRPVPRSRSSSSGRARSTRSTQSTQSSYRFARVVVDGTKELGEDGLTLTVDRRGGVFAGHRWSISHAALDYCSLLEALAAAGVNEGQPQGKGRPFRLLLRSRGGRGGGGGLGGGGRSMECVAAAALTGWAYNGTKKMIRLCYGIRIN